jgi:hypothetical protein
MVLPFGAVERFFSAHPLGHLLGVCRPNTLIFSSRLFPLFIPHRSQSKATMR